MRLLVTAPRGSSSHCWTQPPHCCQPRIRRQRPPCRPISAQHRVTADQWEASLSRTTGSGAVTSYPVTGHSLLGASCRQMEKYRTGRVVDNFSTVATDDSHEPLLLIIRCLYLLHSQVMGNYVRLKASKSAIRGLLTKQIMTSNQS